MIRLPRLALATASNACDPAPASLALLAALRPRLRVQHFRCRARPVATEKIGRVTGLPGRHLDAWLMPAETCRAVFARGARAADLAVVEGRLDDLPCPPGRCPYTRPGQLGPIAEALDLPTVAVVECRRAEGLHLPRLPRRVDAVLLDGLEWAADYEPLRRLVGLALGRPVLGAVEALPAARAAVEAAGPDQPAPEEPLRRLAESFLKFADLAALAALADSRPLPAPPEAAGRPGRRFRVAYAQDEAFGGYFPDTLEMLEALGAELLEFSPLGDGALPPEVDLVMIGCGFPDRFAEALSNNVCLINALRGHVCRGRRIYSEGGGTAYLSRSMILPGRRVPGAHILPIDAELLPEPQGPTPGCRTLVRPACRTLLRDSWLGPAGTVVRGYRSVRWRLLPAPDPLACPGSSGLLTEEGDVYFRHHAVGSLIHLHLAALPEMTAAFAGPHRPSLALPSPPR